MPPVIGVVVAVGEVVVAGAMAPGIPPAVPEMQLPDATGTGKLRIRGRMFQFGEMGSHMMRDGKNIGGFKFFLNRGSEEFLQTWVGKPIFAPNFETEVGRIRRTWIDGADALFEGEIRDSVAARRALTRLRCQICPVITHGPLQPGYNEAEAAAMCLRITLPGASAFASSYVELEDKTIKAPPDEPWDGKPRALPIGGMMAWGW